MKVSITHEHASGVIEALYGTHSIVFDMSESELSSEPEIEFDPNGLYQPQRNTRISAVATLEERITENGFYYSFKIFHNPYAAMPISEEVFKGYKQFVKNNITGLMEWIVL